MRRALVSLVILVIVPAILISPRDARAEYVIGPGDVLSVSYWQQPELDQEVKVRQDGKITLAVIGETQAVGLTTGRLEQIIVERISRVNQNISQVVVTVVEYRSRSVFVGGQVNTPGMLYFEEIPDLWEVIKLAGGPAEDADLTDVTVLRSAEAGGGVIHVDLADILATGELDRLPALHPGYTVRIPPLPVGTGGEQFVDQSKRKKAYYIYGSVASPGRHAMENERIDLLEALVLAGGPGPRADLSKVRVVSKSTGQPVVRIIDLEAYGKTGGPERYILQREDAIYVPREDRGILSTTWAGIRNLLAVTGTVSSLVLILTR